MATLSLSAIKARAPRSRLWRNFDYILFGAVLALIVFGVLMIRSATTGSIDPSIANRVERQIEYAAAGIVIMFAMAAIDYRLLGSTNRYIYLFLVGLLGLVAIAGVVGGAGAKRWLTIGIPIQPSEIAKILLVVVLAEHLQHQYQKMGKISTVLISFAYIGVPVAFIFAQPNLSITILVVVTWFVMVWAAGLRVRHIVLFFGVLTVLIPIIYLFLLQGYQKDRFSSFLAFSNNTCKASDGACYNINQAAISIGTGGLLGEGYANGTQTQLRFLRVRWTDFIFAVIAHELGFVGGVVVLGLIGVVIWRILRAAALARDPLGSLICYGIATQVFFQTFVSIGMNLQLIPVTGLTLPFISSGGSSLLALLFGLGLVESVVMRHKQLDF